MSIKIGMKNRIERTVTKEMLASSIGSGALDVFASPCMISLMEETCFYCVKDELEKGMGTVGTHLDISHDSPTPVGATVYCECELVEQDGRRLVFEVEAFDEYGSIGKGVHERFIVNEEKFMSKVKQKIK